MNQTTAKLILDIRRAKAEKKFPVKIRVVHLRLARDFKTRIDLKEDEFADMQSAKTSKNLKEIKIQLNALLTKANSIIQGLDYFSFERFESQFYEIQNDSKNIFTFFTSYIKDLEAEKRISTASNYRCAMKSIQSFAGRNIGFYDVTEKYLTKYQQWMLDKGNSLTTIGMYSRCLRTIFNIAINEGVIKKENAYPFGRRKFQIPAGANVKKALSIEDIKQIVEFVPSATAPRYEERSRDLWLFSYFSNGMNFKDIANLRWSNFDVDVFRFTRIKTQRAEISNSKVISVYMNKYSHEIISKWGNSKRGKNDFVFDILDKNDNEHIVSKKVYQLVQTTNKNMKRIFKQLGIDKPHTTYVARHSFSTILKKSGASNEQLQELLGHSNPMTTMKYLDSFDDETKKQLSKALINF